MTIPTVSINDKAAINRLVAERVAGWAFHPELKIWHDNLDRTVSLPVFTYSADAVLPLIQNQNEKEKWTTEVFFGAGKCSVYFKSANAEAPTFPLAACCALLRAHGVTVTD